MTTTMDANANQPSWMRRNQSLVWAIVGFLALMVALGVALALGAIERKTSDTIMGWMNFFFLAGIIFKFGRVPMKNFLAEQRSDIAGELTTLQEEKDRCLVEIESVRQHTDENRKRLQEMKDRLVSQGETQKQAIIDQARNQAAQMIQSVRTKLETRISIEKEKLKMELADMAFEQATERLPKMITDTDNAMFVSHYMEGMHSEPLSH